MDRRQDPRTIVTPYAFSVHPDLLGRPLATPWQRLGALAIDGVVIIGLGRLGGIRLAIASALLLFWLAIRKPGKDIVGKLFRFSVGCLGVVILAVTITVVVFVELAEDPEIQALVNDPEIQAIVEERLEASGVSVTLADVLAEDSLVPGNLITDPVALDSLSALNALIQAQAEDTGFLAWLKGLLDDLGIGFGWGALYLTIIHAWWKGRSVGKKIFRIRVVMIDKRPLNLWLSFERVGGYSGTRHRHAGLRPDLLGSKPAGHP